MKVRAIYDLRDLLQRNVFTDAEKAVMRAAHDRLVAELPPHLATIV